MKQLFETAIKNIEELLLLRTKQITLLNELERAKDATAIQFKIKYYKIWINLLRNCIYKGIEIKKKEDILELKMTKSLEAKLIELFENGYIKDIDEAKTEIIDLEKLKNTNTDGNDNLFNSVNSHASITDNVVDNVVDNLEEHQDKVIKLNKNNTGANTGANTTKPKISKKSVLKESSKESIKESSKKSEKIVDTSLIEAQPKILSEETRPTDPRGSAIFDLRYIYGIGPKNAEKLVDIGITLESLLEDWSNWIKQDINNAILMPSKLPIPNGLTKKQWESFSEERQKTIQMSNINSKLEKETKYLSKLNGHQLLGVKYFHDMSQKIPREEVQRAEKILQAAAKHMNSDLMITLCGSYRRGRAKSGDIDCLITHPMIQTVEELDNYPVNILMKFVELLTNLDFLIDHLTDYGRSKYMGFCIIKQQGKKTNTARRIDIRFIPFNSYGASILYFTGSKTFNTTMRTWALGKGYSLNEYGLKRLKDEVLIACKTEEEVFKILDYPYKKPEERDI